MSYPERIVPDRTEAGIVAIHLKRYVFAEPWCRDRVVLDVACGVGYGSAELARTAARVVGGDIDEATVAYARERYAAPNLEFIQLDATAMPFDNASFDVVCSFETIEHISEPERFIEEVSRVLKSDGVFVISTPHVARTSHRPENPFHRIEYARPDFERLLTPHFSSVELYGQRRLQTRRHRALQRIDVLRLRRLPWLRRASVLVGTAPTAEVSLDGVVIEREELERASELVAVCSGPYGP